jgi:hypothetical protein
VSRPLLRPGLAFAVLSTRRDGNWEPPGRERVRLEASTAGRICRLYQEPPKDAVVVCIDEKPMQALDRRYSDRRGHDAVVRHEFEYVRRGVCQLLGAFDVRTGRMLGRVVRKRTAGASTTSSKRFRALSRHNAST